MGYQDESFILPENKGDGNFYFIIYFNEKGLVRKCVCVSEYEEDKPIDVLRKYD